MIKIIKYFFISRVIFIVFAIISIWTFQLNVGYLGNQIDDSVPYLVWIWANFDGRHFLNIATEGYKNFDFAYFPLYPLLIFQVTSLVSLSAIYIGIFISLLSFFLAMVVIYKIIWLDYSNNIAKDALLFLSFFPLAFFYHSVYSDALFLLLSTLSFYFARKKEWVLAGAFGFLSVLTRLSGIALIPALAVEWYIQNRSIFSNLSIVTTTFLKTGFTSLLLTGLGFVLYAVFLKLFYDDPFLFQKSMSAWKQSDFVFPPQVVYRYIKIFLTVDKSLLVYWIAVLEFVTFFAYLFLAFYVAKFVRLSYGVYMIVVLILVTFTGTFAGTPRYLLHLFPAFLGIAILIKKRAKLKFLLLLILIFLGFILTGLFTRGYFIA